MMMAFPLSKSAWPRSAMLARAYRNLTRVGLGADAVRKEAGEFILG
jgi:hypothetical protein